VKVSVLILPDASWSESSDRWRRADEMGFDTAFTYDHLWWRSLADRPWFATFPTLAAAAVTTSRIRLGSLVTTPNLRHPVLAAKDAVALDDLSGGRFTLGVGAGADAGDEYAMTDRPLPAAGRAQRFVEFVEVVDTLLREPVTSHHGAYYRIAEARMIPGCVQSPRLPLAVAAAGAKGMDVAARFGQAWVTYGPTDWSRTVGTAECLAAVRAQVDRLRDALGRRERDWNDIERLFLVTGMAGDPLESTDSFRRIAEDYGAAGINHLVLHWPRESGVYAGRLADLEKIAGLLPEVHSL
jgi:alkanesulfonate monooxygenase SsuD/methylene tetrahydromethanopterin reductase-like flavin-dependent oxidoreductase (luciferase family)